MKQAKLSREQKTALRQVDNAAYKFKMAFAELSEAWQQLEDTNSPIMFMDNSYPFTEKFDTLKEYVGYWCDHISNYTQQITNA